MQNPMFGSARTFRAFGFCTLVATACTLEPKDRSGPDEPEPSLIDAAPMLDAGWQPTTPDGQTPHSNAPDAASTAELDATANLDSALPQNDATLPAADGGEAGVSLPDAEAGIVDTGVGPDAGACSLVGAFGVELLFDVNWRGTSLAGIVPLLQPGSGQIRIIARLDMRGGTTRFQALVTACGATLPDFSAGNALFGTEVYGGSIPEQGWDQPTMPRWDLGWELGCQEPGCSISSELLVATLGARAAAGDVWPGRTGAISSISQVDHDNDGEPAITFLNTSGRNAGGAAYSEIPVSWTLTVRATRAFIPYQVAAQFHGRVDSCDAFSGVVTSGRVEARNVGCYAHNEGQTREFACSAEQAKFLDENLPNWTVMGGSWRARRIDASVDCAAVRSLWD